MSIVDEAGGPATGANVKDGTDQSFMADVIEASQTQPVLVDFWAPWCGPCKTLGPIIEKAVEAKAGKVKLVKVNIDENPGVAGQLGVRSIPAVFAFNMFNGRVQALIIDMNDVASELIDFVLKEGRY